MDKEHPKGREKQTATKFSVHGLSFCAQIRQSFYIFIDFRQPRCYDGKRYRVLSEKLDVIPFLFFDCKM